MPDFTKGRSAPAVPRPLGSVQLEPKGSMKHFKLGFAHVPKLDREAVSCVSDYGAPKYGVKGTREEGEPQPYLRLNRYQCRGVLDQCTQAGQILCETTSVMGVFIFNRRLNVKSECCALFFKHHGR